MLASGSGTLLDAICGDGIDVSLVIVDRDCLAIRAAHTSNKGRKPIFWVRPDYEALEYGALYPQGLVELGFDARNLILIKTANAADALSAANDILACPHVGALLLELCGQPKALDDIAARRLGFIAAEKIPPPFFCTKGRRTRPARRSESSSGRGRAGRPAAR